MNILTAMAFGAVQTGTSMFIKTRADRARLDHFTQRMQADYQGLVDRANSSYAESGDFDAAFREHAANVGEYARAIDAYLDGTGYYGTIAGELVDLPPGAEFIGQQKQIDSIRAGLRDVMARTAEFTDMPPRRRGIGAGSSVATVNGGIDLSRARADYDVTKGIAERGGFTVRNAPTLTHPADGGPLEGFANTRTGEISIAGNARSKGETAAHEAGHIIERHAPESYGRLSDMALGAAAWTNENAVDRRFEQKQSDGYGRDELRSEVTNDIIGAIAGDAAAIRRLTSDRTGRTGALISTFENLKARAKDALGGRVRTANGLELSYTQLNELTDNLRAGLDAARGRYVPEKNVGESEAGEIRHLFSPRGDQEQKRAAIEMEQQGAAPEEIWRATGWGRGLDGKWRTEIDDSGSEFNSLGNAMLDKEDFAVRRQELYNKWFDGSITDEELGELNDLDDRYSEASKQRVRMPKTVRDYLDHEELYKRHPELGDMSMSIEPVEEGTRGFYSPNSKSIALSDTRLHEPTYHGRATTLHELQHAIQDRSAFAGGSSPEEWYGSEAARERSEKIKAEMIRLNMRLGNELHGNEADMFEQYKDFREEMDAFPGAKLSPRYSARYNRIVDALSDNTDFVRYHELRNMIRGGVENYMYYNTAGEIEARDVERRRRLTPEQRRNTFPESMKPNENAVFADGGRSMAIGYTNTNKPVVMIKNDIFAGTTDKPHTVIENYIKDHIGDIYQIISDGEKIYIGKDLPDEYTQSVYTTNLRRRRSKDLLNAKNQAAQMLGELIEIADNPTWSANKKPKHNVDARYGFYRYDTKFAIPKYDPNKKIVGSKVYDAKLLIRHDQDGKKYLYDMIKIKRSTAQLSSTWKNTRSDMVAQYSSANRIPQTDPIVKPSDEIKSSRRPVTETRNLVALHNIGEDKLRQAFELGGLAMPSLAVTKADMGHEGFGDISLVFDKSTIDPEADVYNKVYGGDAYTPTFPKVVNRPDKAALRALGQKLGLSETYLEANYFDDKTAETAAEGLGEHIKTQQAFIADRGYEITPVPQEVKPKVFAHKRAAAFLAAHSFDEMMSSPGLTEAYLDAAYPSSSSFGRMRRRQTAAALEECRKDSKLYEDYKTQYENDRRIVSGGAEPVINLQSWEEGRENLIREHRAEYDEYVRGLVSSVMGDKYIRNDKGIYTDSGNRRSFDALHEPYSLDNVVAQMRSEIESGQGGWLTGAPQVRGAASRRFSSIADIKDNSSRIKRLSDEDADSIRQEFSDRLYAIAARAAEGRGTDPLRAADGFSENIVVTHKGRL